MTEPTNILDARIGEALERGDIAAAAALAATLPKPQHFLDAMIRVNAVINRGMTAHQKGPSVREDFSIDNKPAFFAELQQDKRVSDKPDEVAPPIAVVTFLMTLPSEMLVGFHPNIRLALFHKNGAITHDLANVTQDAPDVRFGDWIYPIKIKKAWENATLTLHYGGKGGPSNIVLADAAISTFEITPKNGSVFILKFTARSNQEKVSVFGKLAELLKTNVNISLDSPEDPAPEEGDSNPKQAAFA